MAELFNNENKSLPFFGCIAWNGDEGRFSIYEFDDRAKAEAFMGLHRFDDRLICSDRAAYYRLRRVITGQLEVWPES